MAIGYDNEFGHCLRNPDIEAGHWYLDPDGSLYIVPRDGEIECPDTEVSDQLDTAYRRLGFDNVCQETIAVDLGLTVIHPWQQRFCEQQGYYSV